MKQTFNRLALLLLTVCAAGAHAEGIGKIYTCTDEYGRRLTSDRPIPECANRDQRELSSTGVTRRVLKPQPTASEIKARQAQAEKEREQRARKEAQRQRDESLAIRYPSLQLHEEARKRELETSALRAKLIEKHVQQLEEEKQRMQERLSKLPDPNKISAAFRHSIEQNEANLQKQKDTLADENAQQAVINKRFDEEQVRLKPFWDSNAAKKAGKR